jgi:hypothetical protein
MKKQETIDLAQNEHITDLVKKAGIPIASCLLYQAIDGASELSCDSRHKDRRADLFYTPIGLVAIRDKDTVIIPLPTVAYARVKAA